MVDALLSEDGRSAATIQVLASLIGCDRDTIRVWRQAGAPDSLDLYAWRAWLATTRKWSYESSLAKVLVDDCPASVLPANKAPAADGGGQSDDDDKGTTEDFTRRLARARALAAERELDAQDGRLVDRQLIETVATRLASMVVARLATGIWPALTPSLDGASPDTRKAVRAAHDAAMLTLRAEFRVAGQHVLAEILPPLAQRPGGRR